MYCNAAVPPGELLDAVGYMPKGRIMPGDDPFAVGLGAGESAVKWFQQP